MSTPMPLRWSLCSTKEAKEHEEARYIMKLLKGAVVPAVYNYLKKSHLRVMLVASSKKLQEELRTTAIVTDIKGAAALIEKAAKAAKENDVNVKSLADPSSTDEPFDFTARKPEVVPSLTREEAECFYNSIQHRELEAEDQINLKSAMEKVICKPVLPYDPEAADLLPSRLLAQNMAPLTALTSDEDIIRRVIEIVKESAKNNQQKILPPIVALCLNEPQMVLNPNCILGYQTFIKNCQTKYRSLTFEWLKSNPKTINISESELQGDKKVRGVIMQCVDHEVAHWVAGVLQNIMKSEIYACRPKYLTPMEGTLSTRELINILKSEVELRVTLNYGANVVGIELQSENFDLSVELWRKVRQDWEAQYPDRRAGRVTFVRDDMFHLLDDVINQPSMVADLGILPPTKAWAANKLLRDKNQDLFERILKLDDLQMFACMEPIRGRREEEDEKEEKGEVNGFVLRGTIFWFYF